MPISRKTKLLAIIFSFLLTAYALCGFLLLPWLLQSKLPALLSARTGQQFSLQAAAFNPFTFKLNLQGFAANNAENHKLLSFDSLEVDFEPLASLFQLSVVFDDISLVKPQFNVQRLANGKFNVSSLIPPKSAAEPEPAKNSPAPAVILRQLTISTGELDWQDFQHAQPQSEHLTGINIALNNLHSVGNNAGTLELALEMATGGNLHWQGDLNLQPLASKGQLKIDALSLPKVWQLFLQDSLPLEISQGTLSLSSEYQLVLEGSQPNLLISNTDVELNQLALTDKTSHASLLTLPALTLNGISIDPAKHHVAAHKLSSHDAHIAASLQADGRLNYQALFAKPAAAAPPAANPSPEPTTITATPEPAAAPDSASPETVPATATTAVATPPVSTVTSTPPPAAPAWQISLAELSISNYQLNFSDLSRKTPQTQQLSAINVDLKQFSNQPGTSSPLQFSALLNDSGKFKLNGKLGLTPLTAALEVDVQSIKLKAFQGYINDYLALQLLDGEFNSHGQLQLQAADSLQLTFQGDANLDNLLTRDKLSNKDFLKWGDLQFQQINADLGKQQYSLGKILFDRPYLRLTIQKNHNTNIADIVLKQPTPAASADADTNQPTVTDKPTVQPNISIGSIEFRDGHSDFADYSLILPFVADMDDLDGQINGFSNTQNQPLKLALQGKVYNMAQVVIKGHYQITTGDSDIDLKFSHMPLPLITPYMADFAGYKIEKGQMALDLQYQIKHAQLTAQNKIFIDQLTLGDKVENPHASSLPLHLAIALLKDSDGKINLDFPITGSLDDPQFSIGGLISDVLGNFINKLVASPFKALGSLLDAEQDHSIISFSPGKTEFKPGETDKLDQLGKALQSKPELTLDIKGMAYQTLDWPEMRFEAMTEILRKMKSGELRDKGEQLRYEYVQLSEDEYKRLLTKFFKELFPQEIEYGLLGKPRLKAQPDGDFYDLARQKLESIMVPEPQRLTDLAIARANAISGYLVAKTGLDQNRIYMLAPELNTTDSNNTTSTLSLNVAH